MDVRISPQASAPQIDLRVVSSHAARTSAGTGGAPAAHPVGKSRDFVSAAEQVGSLLNSLRSDSGPSGSGTKLQLDIDESAGQVYGIVVDSKTGEVIHQIPTKEMRALMARAKDLLGPILDLKA